MQEADSVAELVAVAEFLGAPVMAECATSHGRLAFPADHPLAARGLPLWAPEVRQRLESFDVLLVAGMELLRQYLYFEERPLPEQIKVVHLDDHAAAIGKNFPVEVGMWDFRGEQRAAEQDGYEEIVICLEGSAEIECDGGTYTLEAGDVIVYDCPIGSKHIRSPQGFRAAYVVRYRNVPAVGGAIHTERLLAVVRGGKR